MGSSMARASGRTIKGIPMKETGRTIKQTGKECTIGQMETNMKETGLNS